MGGSAGVGVAVVVVPLAKAPGDFPVKHQSLSTTHNPQRAEIFPSYPNKAFRNEAGLTATGILVSSTPRNQKVNELSAASFSTLSKHTPSSNSTKLSSQNNKNCLLKIAGLNVNTISNTKGHCG